MTTHFGPDPDRPGADAAEREGPAVDAGPPIVAKTVVSATGPAECTLYPRGLPAGERVTTWITAREGSFVPLDEMR
jgi:hypothetical protein